MKRERVIRGSMLDRREEKRVLSTCVSLLAHALKKEAKRTVSD